MAKQTIDYEEVIRDLEGRRAAINAWFDAALEALRAITALHSVESQQILPGVGMPPASFNLPYRDLTMLDAAMKHIRSVGHGVPNVLLAKQLEDGGYKHSSKNFPNTLNSVLWRRAKSVGDIRKSHVGWELAATKQTSGL